MKKVLTLLAFTSLATTVSAADLTVYTYDSFMSEWGPGPKLEQAFEKQCRCDIEFVTAEDGVSILNRLRIEKDKTKADVLLGLDNGLIEEARATGMIQPHQQPTAVLKDELNWNDKDFMPYDYGYFSFVYDSSKVSQPVSSLKELVESDASVIYQDPRTSTPGQGMMLWMKAVYGDDSASAWKTLAQHTVTVTKGWWEAYSMFLQGDADYVLSYSTSPAYHLVAEEKDQYKAALFSEGHVTQIEVAAVTSTSKNAELARTFIGFLTSQEAQQILPVTNWMLPVIDDVKLPAAFDTLIQPSTIGFSNEEISENRKRWLREWRSQAVK